MPLLSVIMPAYNAAHYIGDAIECVIGQTFADWELLVINDGSVDDTSLIANEFALKDDRITVVDTPNRGVSAARNLGLKTAHGRYIMFVDSDDVVDSDFFEVMVAQMVADSNLDFVCSGFIYETVENSSVVCRPRRPVPFRVGDTVDRRVALELPEFLSSVCNKIFKKEFLESNKLAFNESLLFGEDADFVCRALKCGPQFCFLAYSGYRYRMQRSGSLSDKSEVDMAVRMKESIVMLSQNLRSIGADDDIVASVPYDNIYFRCKYLIGKIYAGGGRGRFKRLTKLLAHKELRGMISRANPEAYIDKILKFLIVSKINAAIHLLFTIRYALRRI